MVRIIRVLTYLVCAATFVFGYSFISVKMEYTRMRPQSPQEDSGQVVPASGFYNKTVFLTEAEKGRLDRTTYLACGMFALSLVGMGAVNSLQARARRKDGRQ